MGKIKKFSIVVLIVILIVQAIILSIVGSQKKSYFIDDVWTFEISQGSYDYIFDKYAEKWNTKKELVEKTKINGDERFNLGKVKKAVEGDTVHPPLFYYVLNIIGSIFIHTPLSKVALIVNIVTSLLISVALFFLFRRVKYLGSLRENNLNDDKLSEVEKDNSNRTKNIFEGVTDLLPSIIWAFMPGAIRMVVLYRMYLMLILFCVLTLYFAIGILIKLKLSENKVGIKDVVFLGVALTLGFLTHFYFSFYSFFVVLTLLIVVLAKKRIKELLMIGGGALGALILAHIVYPKLLYFILFSYQTGNAARYLELDSNILLNKAYTMTRMVSLNLIPNKLFSLGLILILLCAVIFFIIRFIVRTLRNLEKGENLFSKSAGIFLSFVKRIYDGAYLIIFAPLTILLIFLIIFSYTSSNRYLSILFLLPLFLLTTIVYKLAKVLKQNLYIIVIAIFMGIFFIGNAFIYVPNEYPVVDNKLKNYHDYPALVVMKAFSTWGKQVYGAFIESILPILAKFPAEIHAREDMYMSNVLGMKDEDYERLKIEPVMPMDISKKRIKYPLKDYRKYITNKNSSDKLVVFIEDETLLKRQEIIETLMKRLNFTKHKKIDVINQWEYIFHVYELYN